jgi:predicted dithiol-disulfide oxidoreductase (DUF899 family)
MGSEREGIKNHQVVSREAWDSARKEHLAKEKEFTKLRDQISQQRRELPWVKVDKEYVFEGPTGKETLPQLFDDRSQLVVYHFMFAPEWQEGCPHCSFWADNFNGIPVHLRNRDVTMLAISRAPLEKLQAFKRRMGWSFKWMSSADSDFNYDFHVSFRKEEIEKGTAVYNYRKGNADREDLHGISAFYKDEGGSVFHTYSTYGRGLDLLNGAYNYLDLVAKGRNEANPGWVRHHDKYE